MLLSFSDSDTMEIFLSIIMGISLSAASGFRVFVPFLVISIASIAGWVGLPESAMWMGTYPALIAFGVAAVVEIGGYYSPWIDNMLDLISSPLAIIAGIVLSGSFIVDINPLLKWTLAIVCGGGAAMNVQLLTVKARALSSFFTTGIGNPIVSTIEGISSFVVSFLAIWLPLIAFAVVVVISILIFRLIRKISRKSKTA